MNPQEQWSVVDDYHTTYWDTAGEAEAYAEKFGGCVLPPGRKHDTTH